MTEPHARAIEARRLLRAARVGTLASSVEGQPFASLITPAVAPDGSALLLLSDLSEHTRHLRAEPRCALLVAGMQPEPNPQTIPRVTVTGLAEPSERPDLKARYLAVHPYAALYAGFGDFHLWRVRLLGGLWVGGFGRAGRLSAADLTPDPAAVSAIAAAEPGIIVDRNADNPDALARVAGEPGDWRLASLDVDGCDLANGERVVRVHWSRFVGDAGEIRHELDRLGGG